MVCAVEKRRVQGVHEERGSKEMTWKTLQLTGGY